MTKFVSKMCDENCSICYEEINRGWHCDKCDSSFCDNCVTELSNLSCPLCKRRRDKNRIFANKITNQKWTFEETNSIILEFLMDNNIPELSEFSSDEELEAEDYYNDE